MSLLMQALKKAEQSKQKQNALAAEAAFSSSDPVSANVPSTPPIPAPAMEMLAQAPIEREVEPQNGRGSGSPQEPFEMPSQELSLSPQMEEKAPEPSNAEVASNARPDFQAELRSESPSSVEGLAINAQVPTLDPLERSSKPAENAAESAAERAAESGHPPQAPQENPVEQLSLPSSSAQPVVVAEPNVTVAPPPESTARPRADPRQAEQSGQKEAEQAVEREKAKSVFSSKSPQGSARKRWLAISGVLILLLIGGAAYVYLQGGATVPPVPMRVQTEPPLDPSSAPETPNETAVVEASASVVSPELAKTNNPANKDQTANTAQAAEAASAVQHNSAGAKEVGREVLKEVAQAKGVPAASSALPVVVPSERLPSVKVAANAEKNRNAASASTELGGAIQIRKSNSGNQINPDLALAYQSLIAGDVSAAESQYQTVLRQEPNNRDALLGLAAIALNQRQAERSGAFYGKLLELDPNDPEAIAGLTSLQQGDPAQSESRLKRALNQHPHAGSILFALGNLYAQQSRWSDAQQSYFRAFDTAPSNADYAFNLAVSLDRLNQGKLAKDYYQRALNLGQSGPGNFSRSGVQKRIKELDTPSGE